MSTESRLHHLLYQWLYPLLFIAALVGVSWYCAAHQAVLR